MSSYFWSGTIYRQSKLAGVLLWLAAKIDGIDTEAFELQLIPRRKWKYWA